MGSGIVFGGLDVLRVELPKPFDEWLGTTVELREVPTFQKPPVPKKPRRPQGATEKELRIYEARYRAYLRAMTEAKMKGQDHV
jgi:hypothetical protein